MKDLTDVILDNHVRKLIDTIDIIALNEPTLLVGSNGSGKSLIRKQLPFHLGKKLNLTDAEVEHTIRSISMQKRTEQNFSFKALSTVMHDLSWLPTSLSTYNLVDRLFKGLYDNKNKSYYVIDEPEIGMTEESQLGFAILLRRCLPLIMERSLGILVITNSRIMVEALQYDMKFFYIGIDDDYELASEWLYREIIPTNFLFLNEWSDKLYSKIREKAEV